MIQLLVAMTTIYSFQVLLVIAMWADDCINSKLHLMKLLIPFIWIVGVVKFICNEWKKLPYKNPSSNCEND